VVAQCESFNENLRKGMCCHKVELDGRRAVIKTTDESLQQHTRQSADRQRPSRHNQGSSLTGYNQSQVFIS